MITFEYEVAALGVFSGAVKMDFCKKSASILAPEELHFPSPFKSPNGKNAILFFWVLKFEI